MHLSPEVRASLLAPDPEQLDRERILAAGLAADESEASLTYRRLYGELRELLDDDARAILLELDNAVCQRICDYQGAVLDQLVIGFVIPGSAPDGMYWRTTRRTEINLFADHDRHNGAITEVLAQVDWEEN